MRIVNKEIELKQENKRLRQENEKLRAENQSIRAENVRLHERIEVLEKTLEERISKAVEEAVAKATEPLYAIIAEKDKAIAHLKSQLNKDSSNFVKAAMQRRFQETTQQPREER